VRGIAPLKVRAGSGSMQSNKAHLVWRLGARGVQSKNQQLPPANFEVGRKKVSIIESRPGALARESLNQIKMSLCKHRQRRDHPLHQQGKEGMGIEEEETLVNWPLCQTVSRHHGHISIPIGERTAVEVHASTRRC